MSQCPIVRPVVRVVVKEERRRVPSFEATNLDVSVEKERVQMAKTVV